MSSHKRNLSNSPHDVNCFVPPILRHHGVNTVHPYPLVLAVEKVPEGRKPAAEAWATYPRVQLNPENEFVAINVDVDSPAMTGWIGGKPSLLPSWLVQADTGKMHVAYVLEVPVHRNPESLASPLQKLARITDSLTHHLGGDERYTGLIIRNPVNPGPGAMAHFFRMIPFTLDEIDKATPRYASTFGQRLTGIGRNVDLFQVAVSQAHRPSWQPVFASEGWEHSWLAWVAETDHEMHHPYTLPAAEHRSIAKSCWKYAVRQFSPERFAKIQRGRISKRWHGKADYDYSQRDASILSLRKIGYKASEIGPIVGLSKRQVNRRIASGTYHNS